MVFIAFRFLAPRHRWTHTESLSVWNVVDMCVCVCVPTLSAHLELVDSLAILTTEVAQLDTEIADLFPQHRIRAHFI